MACSNPVCPAEDIQSSGDPAYSFVVTIDLRDILKISGDSGAPPDAYVLQEGPYDAAFAEGIDGGIGDVSSAPNDAAGGAPIAVPLDVETDAGIQYVWCDEACLPYVEDPAVSCTDVCKVLAGGGPVTVESCQFSEARSRVTCHMYSAAEPQVCDGSDVPGSGG